MQEQTDVLSLSPGIAMPAPVGTTIFFALSTIMFFALLMREAIFSDDIVACLVYAAAVTVWWV